MGETGSKQVNKWTKQPRMVERHTEKMRQGDEMESGWHEGEGRNLSSSEEVTLSGDPDVQF